MKSIKIDTEHRDVFQVMTNCKVKRIVLGLMDVAMGEEPRGITKDILPTFEKLREQLGDDNKDDHKWRDGLDELIKAHEEKRAFYEEKVKALRMENDTAIREEKDAVEAEGMALEEEHKALTGEYEALMERLKACEGGEEGRRRYRGKFMALEERRKALRERRGALDERRKALIERSVNFLAASATNLERECGVLKEENKLLMGARADFDEGWKPIEREPSETSTADDLLPIPKDAPSDDANGGGCVVSNDGVVLTKEVWKVVDENWEQLKDAVYRMKVKKEEIPDVDLSVEAWGVLDHHFDELAKLFHL